ncbi:MAG: hypothetical protein FJW52_02020 [Actinobacteria bacterium]|nr:hypothetical protein [Actinomycetota bacterium]
MSEVMAIKWAAESASAPLSALIWWLIPLTAAVGAAGYVIWVTKFQKKYENKTERSVGRFQSFQKSFKSSESDKE